MGFHKRLLLNDNAVPTIHTDPDGRSSSTNETVKCLPVKEVKQVGCMTEPIKTREASVQAWVPRPRYRSKAVQTGLPKKTYTVKTQIHADPLEIEYVIPDFMASSDYKRDRASHPTPVPMETSPSNTISCQTSISALVPTKAEERIYLTTDAPTPKKYVVHQDRLLRLFKACRVCRRTCRVVKSLLGPVLTVKQSCPHCSHTWTWRSQRGAGNLPAGCG